MVEPLTRQKYDAIIATYSLHHLTDEEKLHFITKLLTYLNKAGKIYIGDVIFQTKSDLEVCKKQQGERWDKEEIYFVYDEFQKLFKNTKFTKFSDCAGVIEIW